MLIKHCILGDNNSHKWTGKVLKKSQNEKLITTWGSQIKCMCKIIVMFRNYLSLKFCIVSLCFAWHCVTQEPWKSKTQLQHAQVAVNAVACKERTAVLGSTSTSNNINDGHVLTSTQFQRKFTFSHALFFCSFFLLGVCLFPALFLYSFLARCYI